VSSPATGLRSDLKRLLLAPLLCLLAVPVASAQDDLTTARARFEDAQAAFDAGDYPRALEQYEASYALMDGHPNQEILWFNIASCHDRLGNNAEAVAAYRRFLERAPDAAADYRGEAQVRIRALEATRASTETVAGSVTAGDAAPREEASVANWLVAAGLLALAVAPIAVASWTLATEGECVDSDMTGCVEQVRFGAVDVTGLVLGGLAVVGAVIFAAAQPLRVEVQASDTAVMLRARGRF